ncbi:hypothetical protein CORC01_04210 [Colletotrichum orchidophilum]|uniref:Carrier domain-containing protein n=1 Tax=Colletotrichum orchidophilum TaxID=1209926 RepID=A0A1G4BG43_9PEZI|nr:uncharacterized protein CORC01_04210 [Colletotrichum orchidophilum]OHF00460.1 hypothetical protein CORC01_04210 [Colletotrichum orchidophilum]
MQLIRHIEKHEDFFLPSPDDLAFGIHDKLYSKESALAFSEVEARFPATEIQRDILGEDVQWAEVELFSGKPSSFGLENIFNAWNSLASHHVCLRSYIMIDTKSGQPQVVVLRRVEGIRWNHPEKSSIELSETPAYVTVESTRRRDGISLVLHFHRALIDTTSLHMIKLDYALQVHGLPSLETAGFATYVRYIDQQRKNIKASRAFWIETLADTVPQSVFGAHAGGQSQNITRDRHGVSAVISGPELAQLNDLEAHHGLGSWRQTFFEVVWAHVIRTHTGSDDVVFGTVRRDESFIGSDTCVGCVDQTYPVRFHVADDQGLAIREASKALDLYHSEAGRHAFVGLKEIQRHAENVRLVETAVSYSQTTNTPCIAPGLRQFPVVLCISDSGVLRLTLKCKAYIPLEEIEVVLQHFVSGIVSAASKLKLADDCKLVASDLTSEDEQRFIMSQSLATRTAEPTTIPALFEKTAAAFPERIAVESEGSAPVTFLELNSQANLLARRLKLTRGSYVPILAERSLELVIAILAVLKSGAAYTVLDPDTPSNRLEQIIDDLKPATVLASHRFANVLENARDIQHVLHSSRHNLSGPSPDELSNLGIEIHPEDRCYVIYTSGSTGKPKGAVLTHRAATSGMAHQSLNELERWLLFYNPSFSAAQRTILGTLVHGATLILASKESLTDDLASVINKFSVDSLGITPSALSLLQPSDVPGLKQITLVGEQIPQDLVEIWSAQNGLRLRNTYGLSECTQLNFGKEIQLSSGSTFNHRIVGSPADTTDAFILGQGNGQLAPLLVAGELCLAGPQLAEGYLNEAALTARAFVDNPFGAGKLYRTGDRARRLADGQIEILGRADMQVKINGQKVEPAEVDRLLRSIGAVSASVTLGISLNDRKILASAVVLASDAIFRTSVIAAREHLHQSLPGYMVPSIWFPVTEIPKNANGKINYAHLRNSAEELGTTGFAKLMETDDDDYVVDSVADDTEVAIALAWSSVLSIGPSAIKRSHSFTDLGGSSIEAIKAVSELRKAGLSVDLSEILGGASLETVAARSQAFNAESQQEPASFALVADPLLASDLQRNSNIIDAYPATPFQETMLASLNTPSDPYTYSRTWDVSGVDLRKLRESFNQVFRTRDILRAVFLPHKRSFLQTIRNDLSLPWHESLESLESFTLHRKTQQWELDAPLWKVTVLTGKVLIVTMHHSLFDYWSHKFLYEDVASVYLGKSTINRPAFSNFARHLQSQDNTANEIFWANYLEGAQTAKLNHSPGEEASKIEVGLSFSVSEQARGIGSTLGAVVYSAWSILLSHHLRSDDVTFATTISGREVPVAGIHEIDGPTMTSVPQRVKVDPNSTVRDHLKKTLSGFAQLLKHSQFGIVGAMRAGNLPSQALDTLVNILVSQGDTESGPGPNVEEVFRMHGRRPQWASGSDTTVLEVEEATTTTIRLISTMEPRRLEFLKESFIKILNILLSQPDTKLTSVSVLGNAETDYTSNTLSNRTRLQVPEAELLHSAFERIAASAPDAVAIDFDGKDIVSYAHLDEVSNRFAHTLIAHGVFPGDLVPLMLEKSVDMMVAILGVMKAGGAYVPLSPDNPNERNGFVVSDTRAKLLVAHPQHADFGVYVKKLYGIETLVMPSPEMLSSVTSNGSDANVRPTTLTTPDNLAYMIYTSGSTGMPKGVMVPHRAAAAAVTSMAQVEGRFQGTWRTLQFANYVFDASVQDFFNTLSTGGTLCMAPTETLLSDIAGCINRMNVRQAIITPTVAKLFSPEDVPGFETLIVGGEPLTPDVVDVWSPHCKILNVYGPTETSMVVTTKSIEPSSKVTSHRIGNIGAPFPTVMAFILSPEGETLVPYGAIGELCIAGPQVTDGYMNRLDLTEAAYVDSKFLGARIYRTGDLARWLPGGEIECLGRKDNQVKIHGHRIELGEVENSIRRSGLVKDTVALATDIQGKAHLIAFCVFDEASAAVGASGVQDPSTFRGSLAELRENLSSLATYMVPKFVVPMSALPTLPSRKVDRKALKLLANELEREYLAQCVLETPGEDHEVIPVQTASEEVLELVWVDIFGVPQSQIGREANFFTLGGDSISAISLTGQLRRVGYSLTVLDILKAPKLKDMASNLRKTEARGPVVKRSFEVPQAVKIASQEKGLTWDKVVDHAYPCPPGQAEFLKQGSRESQMWALQTVRRMTADVDPDTWIQATTRLTELNEILRTTWLETLEAGWVGVVLRSPQLNVTQVALDSEAESSSFVEEFWQARFEFGRPFIKYAVITHSDASWDLVIKMDHAVYDGTLLRVFDEHFGAILRGESVPPPVEFRDFSQHVFAEDKTSCLGYWKAKMDGLGPVDQQLHGQDLAAASSPKITASLRRDVDTTNIDVAASRLGVTPSIIFQGAFSLWLAAATDTTDVRFDYLLSGRNVALPDPQSINGTLANFLPFRTPVDSKESVRDFLAKLQDDFWDVTENGLVGLDDIYGVTGLSRGTHGNRVLFLSQPFEPAAKDDPNGRYRWLVMAKSKVRMYQPYALVVEVSKSLGDRHILKVMYDDTIWDLAVAEKIADDIVALIEVLTDVTTGDLALEEL